jgi:hypothetical protein
MLQKVLSLSIQGQQDMTKLEQTVACLLGGEHHKCSFVRSQDFIKLRLQALYHPAAQRAPLVVYGEGLKICLDNDNLATVYLVDPSIDPDLPTPPSEPTTVLGKRAQPETGQLSTELLQLIP